MPPQHPFSTEAPTLCGPLRQPRQMLAEQKYDGHKSIHDDAMAEGLGLRAGPIEGPTHFSQFDPLLFHVFGPAWFETGCISAHYQNMVVEGEEVRAFVEPPASPQEARFVRIRAEKRDGTPVLAGSASVGDAAGLPHEIRQRIAKLRPPTGSSSTATSRSGNAAPWSRRSAWASISTWATTTRSPWPTSSR